MDAVVAWAERMAHPDAARPEKPAREAAT